jgi:hypothetical protein
MRLGDSQRQNERKERALSRWVGNVLTGEECEAAENTGSHLKKINVHTLFKISPVSRPTVP